MSDQVQLAVIGGGPAGRHAARHARRKGANVALISRSFVGRPQLDQKAISFLALQAEHAHFIGRDETTLAALKESLTGAMEVGRVNRESEVGELRDSGVLLVTGFSAVAAPDVVCVTCPGGKAYRVACESIILAPGVEPFIAVDSRRVAGPHSMVVFEKMPETLAVLGSDRAALELARYFSAWDIDVSLVGGRRALLEFLDPDLREIVTSIAADNGIRVILGVSAVAGTVTDRVDIMLSDGTHLDSECAFVCGEGKYRTETLGLEGLGVGTGPDGEISVDANMRTNIPQVYAVGAVTGDCSGMNTVRRQAEVAVENALGLGGQVDYDCIPVGGRFIPEIAAVGLREETARDRGFQCVAALHRISLGSNVERIAKIVAEPATGRLMGVQLAGRGSLEAIQAATLALHAGMTLDELGHSGWLDDTMFEVLAAWATIAGYEPWPESTKPIVGGQE